VTNLALVSVGGRWRLIVAEGESIAIQPRPVAAPQMLFKPKKLDIADWCDAWLKAGSPHHMALAYGHLSDKLRTLAALGNWDFIEV
jgi:L-arabinose isomerase